MTPILLVGLIACGDQGAAPTPDSAKTNKTTASAASSNTAAATNSTPPPASATASDATPATSSATASAETSASGSAKPVASTTTGATTTTTASAAASAPDVQGAETKQAAFSAYLSGKGTYKVGQQGTVTAVVTALGEYHVNPEYPYKFVLNAAPAGVSFGETTIRTVSRSEKKASISIPFSADAAGTATISGVCSLSVCTAQNCVVEKVPLSVSVKIE
ncbi:MAG: hypothetical protein U0271_22910 [Polyangiaceae bacterium]